MYNPIWLCMIRYELCMFMHGSFILSHGAYMVNPDHAWRLSSGWKYSSLLIHDHVWQCMCHDWACIIHPWSWMLHSWSSMLHAWSCTAHAWSYMGYAWLYMIIHADFFTVLLCAPLLFKERQSHKEYFGMSFRDMPLWLQNQAFLILAALCFEGEYFILQCSIILLCPILSLLNEISFCNNCWKPFTCQFALACAQRQFSDKFHRKFCR